MKVFFKFLGVAILVTAILIAAAYGWIARDRGPTHPTLVAAQLPPLIPLRDFWANRDSEWGYSLSPGGSYLSWWTVEGTDLVLNVLDRSTGSVQVVRPENSQRASYEWSYDDRSLQLRQFKDDRWSIWRIDAANVTAPWVEVTPRGFQHWSSLYRPKAQGERRILATRDRSAEFADVYAVNQDGLNKTLLLKNPGNVIDWRADRNGAVFLRTVNSEPGLFRLEYDPERNGRNWRPLLTRSSRDFVWPLGEDGTGGLLAFSNLGREHIAAVRIDLSDGTETVLLEDRTRSVVRSFSFERDKPGIDLVEFGGGYPEYHAVTPLGDAVLQALHPLETPFEMSILSTTASGNFVTLAINQREDGWRYALVDTQNRHLQWIGAHDLTRHADKLAETSVHMIEARDGFRIPILLTRPRGVEGPAPMVALIHGGPMSHDRWSFRRNVQFLANRGYAVMRVNYRGSTGFGRTSERAGDHQYGRGMQDDIQDAVRWAIDNDIADAQAVAVMGHSFGGYSAMMGVARDPGFYAAGISISGAVDLEHQTANAPHFWGVDKTYWTQVIGDPDNPSDRAEMRAHSPIHLVDRIVEPVLLAHGVNDRVVDRADTEQFERRLRELGKPHQAVYFEKEQHVFRRWQTNVRFYRVLEEFLARHLGGRSGGFDYVEIGAEYLYP